MEQLILVGVRAGSLLRVYSNNGHPVGLGGWGNVAVGSFAGEWKDLEVPGDHM